MTSLSADVSRCFLKPGQKLVSGESRERRCEKFAYPAPTLSKTQQNTPESRAWEQKREETRTDASPRALFGNSAKRCIVRNPARCSIILVPSIIRGRLKPLQIQAHFSTRVLQERLPWNKYGCKFSLLVWVRGYLGGMALGCCIWMAVGNGIEMAVWGGTGNGSWNGICPVYIIC